MILTIHTQKETAALGDLYGLFFEDLNHAADGGLYAELVQNRSFEFSSVDNPAYCGLTAWEKIENSGRVDLAVLEGDAISKKNPHYLELRVTEPGDAGVQNLGFNSGIPLQKDAKYNFSCYARCRDARSLGIRVSLRSVGGAVYQEKIFSLTEAWEKYEAVFTAPAEDWSGRLSITAEGTGRVHLDFVSLFPQDTYKGRRNGLRRDLAEALEAMHPKFLRFPGGCLVHDGSLNPEDRSSQYRWKNSIGPLEHRPARRNNWGYNQTLGLGYYEYFLLCEDLGAKPLPVLPGGYNPHNGQAAEGTALEAFVQDAQDLIEFANGGLDTKWGAKRAELGHPEPFGLEYLAIGNEEVGEVFFERYPLFYNAIKANYPAIKVIGTSGPFAAGKEYDRGWRSARQDGAELVDEHYYQSPEWFVAHHHRYDDFPAGPTVFLGEYASKGNAWINALAEASYMIGLERNARVVGLACYAPLFCNVDYVNWRPNMIWFDNHQIMCTPSYYVQKLFMEHQGDVLLEQEMTGAEATVKWHPSPDDLTGGFALSGHDSRVEYSEITITNPDTTGQNDFTRFRVKPGYQNQLEAVFKARHIGWSRERIGSHIIRDNVICDCGQNGIVGHLGCIFSEIYGNEIFNIAVKHEFYGHEIAGIKLHAAIDVQIRRNYIHHCSLGTWLDWQAQGTRVSGNVYDCNNRDLMVEVAHGPCLVDNNIFASPWALVNAAQGSAYVHNLFCGFIDTYPVLNRATPYHLPHSTEILGTALTYGGDDRWMQNIFAGGCEEGRSYGTAYYNGSPVSHEAYAEQVRALGNGDVEQFEQVRQTAMIRGNLYLNGALQEIHRVYPDIRLIGTAGPELDSPRFEAAWRFYRENEGKNGFVYAVDEHYYTKPEWFLTHCGYFDHVSRETKVFFGEYAAHSDRVTSGKTPRRNTLEAALSEAAFLTGMARNSDAVVMTCYAPLLARMGYAQWSPNLIWFDGKSICRTPSYYVQQMFSENLGDFNIGIADGEIPCQASYDNARKELVLMLANGSGDAKEIPLAVDPEWVIEDRTVQEILLTGEGRDACNLLGEEKSFLLSGKFRYPLLIR